MLVSQSSDNQASLVSEPFCLFKVTQSFLVWSHLLPLSFSSSSLWVEVREVVSDASLPLLDGGIIIIIITTIIIL